MKNIILFMLLVVLLISCGTQKPQINYQIPEEIKNYDFAQDLPQAAKIQATMNPKLTAYITIDDFNEYTSKAQLNKILAVLDKYNAKATFFVNCQRLYEEPATLDWMKLIVSKGHELGNHSYDHFQEATDWVANNPQLLNDPNLGYTYAVVQQSPVRYYTMWYGYQVGLEKLSEQISKCDGILGNIKGYKKIFRPPFGQIEPVLLSALAKNNYTDRNIYLWTTDLCDYVPQTTAQEIRDAMLLGKMPSYCAENNNFNINAIRNNSVIDAHWSDGTQTAEGLDLALKILSKYFIFPVAPELNSSIPSMQSLIYRQK